MFNKYTPALSRCELHIIRKFTHKSKCDDVQNEIRNSFDTNIVSITI